MKFVPTLLVGLLGVLLTIEANALPMPASTLPLNTEKSIVWGGLTAATAAPHSTILGIPRGGSGTLIPRDAAVKAFLAVFGLNCLQGVLFPAAHIRLFSIEPDLFICHMTRELCGIGCSITLLFYLQIFQEMPFTRAVGWSTFPFNAQVVYKWATGVFADLRIPDFNAYSVLGIGVAVAYACLSGSTFAEGVVKFYGAFSLLNAIPLLLKPEQAAKAWNMPPLNATQKHVLGAVGVYCLAHFSAIGLQAYGIVDDYLSLGWTIASLAAGLVVLMVKGSYKDADIPLGPSAVWVLGLSVLAHSVLAGGNAGTPPPPPPL